MKRMQCVLLAVALVAALWLPAQATGNGETAYRALLIGIDGYQTNALSGCVTDAGRMANTLQTANEAGAFYQSPVIRSNLQTNEINALFKEVDTWNVDDDDVTFFFFAGHGYMSERGTPAIVGKDSQMLAISDLLSLLDSVPGVKVVAFDCRYADSLLKDEPSIAQALSTFNSAVIDVFRNAPTSANYYVLTGSTLASSEALAVAETEEQRGMITYYLTQGCGYDYVQQRPADDLPADINGNGAVSLSEALDYIQKNIAALTASANIVYDLQIFPTNSAYPVIARRATSEVLEVKFASDNITVPVDKSRQLEAMTQPANASKRSIYWSSSDLSIARVDEDGNVYGVRPGDTQIAATTSNGLTVSTTVNVRDISFIESIELNLSRAVIGAGTEIPLEMTISPADSNELVSWRSDNPAIATVDEKGLIRAVTLGETFVAATSENGVEAVCMVKVIEPQKVVTRIQVNKSNLKIYAGESRQISTQIKPSNAEDQLIVFRSSDPNIATVDNSGVISGVASGDCIIYAVASSGIYAQCNVTVDRASILLNKDGLLIKRGESVSIKTQVKPSSLQALITWTSSDPAIATVENGKVTAVDVGEAIVTASLSSGESAQCKIVVDGTPIKQMKLDSTKLKMEIDEEKALTLSVNPQNATLSAVSWKSGNEKVATVDQSGNVKAVGAGRTTITATAYSGVKATCQVLVAGAAVSDIALNETDLTLVADLEGQSQFALTATTAQGEAGSDSVRWASSDSKVASVDEHGVVTAKSAGRAIIRAVSQANKSVKADCRLTVTSNRTQNKKPIYGKEAKLYTSARRVYYKGGYLVVELYYSNRTKSTLTVPEAGSLVMKLADGTIYTLTDVSAGKSSLKPGKTGVLSYKIEASAGNDLFGLDLRNAQVEYVKAGETPSFGEAETPATVATETPAPTTNDSGDKAPDKADPLTDDTDSLD